LQLDRVERARLVGVVVFRLCNLHDRGNIISKITRAEFELKLPNNLKAK